MPSCGGRMTSPTSPAPGRQATGAGRLARGAESCAPRRVRLLAGLAGAGGRGAQARPAQPAPARSDRRRLDGCRAAAVRHLRRPVPVLLSCRVGGRAELHPHLGLSFRERPGGEAGGDLRRGLAAHEHPAGRPRGRPRRPHLPAARGSRPLRRRPRRADGRPSESRRAGALRLRGPARGRFLSSSASARPAGGARGTAGAAGAGRHLPRPAG